jgi:hypothetical protein
MTIAQLVSVAPQRLVESVLLEGQLLGDEYLQTRGDLEDLHYMVVSDANNVMADDYQGLVDKCIEVKIYMMKICGVVGFEDARHIPMLERFRDDFPAIYATFECYAWS